MSREGDTRENGIRVGYSTKFDTPEFQEALRVSNRSHTRIMVICALVVPLVATLIAALFVRGDNATMAIGVLALSCVLIYLTAIPLFAVTLIRRNTAKPWDGVVTDLVCRRVRRGPDTYTIVCRTDEGKRERVRDYANHPLFDYLEVGDRVRFRPRLNVPLEKYDKTRDAYLVCPFCGSRQALENDDCDKCAKPLLK